METKDKIKIVEMPDGTYVIYIGPFDELFKLPKEKREEWLKQNSDRFGAIKNLQSL